MLLSLSNMRMNNLQDVRSGLFNAPFRLRQMQGRRRKRCLVHATAYVLICKRDAVVAAVPGSKLDSAEAYFAIYLESPAAAVLRGDFLLLILIGLYLGTFPALYVALRRECPVDTALAILFTIMAVAGTFATESTVYTVVR